MEGLKILISINGEVEYESVLVDVASVGITQKYAERNMHGQLDAKGMEEMIIEVGIAETQETLYPETEENVQSG